MVAWSSLICFSKVFSTFRTSSLSSISVRPEKNIDGKLGKWKKDTDREVDLAKIVFMLFSKEKRNRIILKLQRIILEIFFPL